MAVAKSGYIHGQSTSTTSIGSSPAAVANPRSATSSESANGPGAPGGGAGSSGRSSATSDAASIPSGLPHVITTTKDPGRTTRLASARAAPGFAAYWKELNPVTRSNELSSNGSI